MVNLEVDVLAKYVEKLVAAMNDAHQPFATVEDAIEDISAGRMVVVCDDEDRENEGDLTMAAEFATPEAINFMARQGRGLDLPGADARRAATSSGSTSWRRKNESRFGTAFTRVHRGARGHHDRHLGARPGAHDPGGGRPGDDARPTSCSPATSSR